MTPARIVARRRRQRPHRLPKRVPGRVTQVVAAFALLLALAASGGVLYAQNRYDGYASDVAPPETLLAELPRGGARIYDRNGILLYEFVDELSGLRRPVALSEISPWLVAATVATEDATFWTNNGLNTRGLARAAIENLSPWSGDDFFDGSGGSSITQQLAKNVYIPADERTDRSIDRKLRETVIALELTRQYSKEQILEWYLNSISYSGIYVGIEAAAQGYFGKPAADLTLAEAALLAGIPQSPAQYNPVQHFDAARGRQREVLDLMVRQGLLSPAEADHAFAKPIALAQRRFEIEAAHFVLGPVADELTARFGEDALYTSGLEVVTTLDLNLQHEAERILEHWITEFEQQSNGHNGAFYALRPNTGEVLVYVGSRDYFRDDIQGRNDNIRALNSPGSTLKPFTYMTTFMKGWSTGTGILDLPAGIKDAATDEFFEPRNPSGDYQGLVTVAEALGNSLNVPAFKAIMFAGVNDTVQVMRSMGLTTLHNPLGYGPALTLGGVDITLGDVTLAYSVLANNGVMRGQESLVERPEGDRTIDPVHLLRVTDSRGEVLHEAGEPAEQQIVDPAYAYLVTSILSDPGTQCITFTCGGLSLPDGRPAAQKTGTSEPYEDSKAIGETWTFGYTPQLVAGIWAGNSDNSPMQNIVSTSISWRAWRDFMDYAHRHLQLDPQPFERPEGVVEKDLCWPSGKLPTPACPANRRYKGLFAAEVLADDAEHKALRDDWWRAVRIDSRTGVLATASTPDAYVVTEVRLVFPSEEELLPEEPSKRTSALYAWASAAGLGRWLAPTSGGSANGAVAITSPADGQQVSGVVQLLGRATSPGFRSYSVDISRNSGDWQRIARGTTPVQSGALGSWDTRAVPDGTYTIRVTVNDEQSGTMRQAVTVVVANGQAGGAGGGSEGGGTAPYVLAQITSPASGSTVSGVVNITGSALAGRLVVSALEVRPDDGSAGWTAIAQPNGIVDGVLASWNTSAVPNGSYTLRLIVQDAGLGARQVSVNVTVLN